MKYDFAIRLLQDKLAEFANLRTYRQSHPDLTRAEMAEIGNDYILAINLLESKQTELIERMKAEEIEDTKRWLVEG